MTNLIDTERAMLDLEGAPWRYGAAKERAIAERFGMEPVRYRQQLAALIRRPEAMEYAPIVVGRLRRAVGL